MQNMSLFLLFVAIVVGEGCLYVSPSAAENGNGTISFPFSSISAAKNGDLNVNLCLLEGLYSGPNNRISFHDITSVHITGFGNAVIGDLGDGSGFNNITSVVLSNLHFLTNIYSQDIDFASMTNISFVGIGFNGCCKDLCNYTFSQLSCQDAECNFGVATCPPTQVVIDGFSIVNSSHAGALTSFSVDAGYVKIQNAIFHDNKEGAMVLDCLYCRSLFVENSLFIKNTVTGKFPLVRLGGINAAFHSVLFQENSAENYLVGPVQAISFPMALFVSSNFSCNSIMGSTSNAPFDPSVGQESLLFHGTQVDKSCPISPCKDGLWTENALFPCQKCGEGQVASGPISSGCEACKSGYQAEGYQCVLKPDNNGMSPGVLAAAIIVPIVVVGGALIGVVVYLKKRKAGNESNPLLKH